MSILRDEQQIFGLTVDETAKSYLYNTARWAKFLGIIYFIMTGIVATLFPVLVFETNSYNFMPDDGKLIMVLVVVAFTIGLNFYPLFALIRFSAKIKPALQTDSQQLFHAGLRTMKNMFKYIGILTIVFISLYGVMFLMAIISQAMRG